MANMESVFTTARPFRWDTQRFADAFRSAFSCNATTESRIHVAGLFGGALSTARTGRGTLHNSVDQGASKRFLRDLVHWQIKLKQAHGALDIHAHRAWVYVSR